MSILTKNQMSQVRNKKGKSRGAAIMLALWALFLLSALVISWALDIDSRLSLSGEGNRMLKAEAVACSGAEVALHPSVKPGSPNLSGEFDNGAKYEARLTGDVLRSRGELIGRSAGSSSRTLPRKASLLRSP